MSVPSLFRTICILAGLAMMGYTLSIGNYEAWQRLFLIALLFGSVLAWALIDKVPTERWQYLYRLWQQASRYPRRSLLVVGWTLLIILIHLGWKGTIPRPGTYDEVVYLLHADTFLQGRWTNPTPAGWEHFESLHVTLSPTYHGKYQPGMGMILALGQWLFQHPYAGVVLALLFASVSLDWMFSRWLPDRWGLLASLAASLTLVENWNNYLVGGPLSAATGALLLGTLRAVLERGSRWTDGFVLGICFTLFFWTRPFEGAIFSAVVCLYAVWELVRLKRWRELVWPLLPGCLFILCIAGVVQASFNQACVGSYWYLPYLEHERQYFLTPSFLWQSLRQDVPVFRHRDLQKFHEGVLDFFQWQQSGQHLLEHFSFKWGVSWLWFHHVFWLAFIAVIPELLSNRWCRFALILWFIFLLSTMWVTWLFPHYIAVSLGLVTYVMVMSLRYLAAWKYHHRPVGRWLTTALVLSYVMVFVLKLQFTAPTDVFPEVQQRHHLEQQLQSTGEKHLVIVEYSENHPVGHDWIYNSADFSKQPVLWARSMSKEKNQNLLKSYPERRAWLLHVDNEKVQLLPYPR